MNLEDLSKEELIFLLQKNRDSVRKSQLKNQEKRLWTSCKQRADLQGIDFDISVEDIVIPETCIYLGCKLTNILGEGRVWSNASVDRIDPELGYVSGNIRVISDLANRMKQNATREQLVAFAEGVLSLYNADLNSNTP